MRHLILIALGVTTGLAVAWGQSAINWYTMDGGGGTSTAGVYAVSGTVGQPDAGGAMTGSVFSVTGGFWVLPVAVQTEGAPHLSIERGDRGTVLVSWAPDLPGYLLQETYDVPSGTWSNSPSGSLNPAVVPTTLPRKFYRVFNP